MNEENRTFDIGCVKLSKFKRTNSERALKIKEYLPGCKFEQISTVNQQVIKVFNYFRY